MQSVSSVLELNLWNVSPKNQSKLIYSNKQTKTNSIHLAIGATTTTTTTGRTRTRCRNPEKCSQTQDDPQWSQLWQLLFTRWCYRYVRQIPPQKNLLPNENRISSWHFFVTFFSLNSIRLGHNDLCWIGAWIVLWNTIRITVPSNFAWC